MAKKKKKKKAEHYRTGQYVKPKRTGKVTTNLSQEDWETDTSKPITSRTGVIGHQKKLKKKGELYPKVKIEDLPTSRKQRLTAKERKELIGMGVDPDDIKATVEEKKVARAKQRAEDAKDKARDFPLQKEREKELQQELRQERGLSDPNLAAKTGGTIKRKSGGALGTGAALRGYGKGYKKGGTI